ncbi:MAG: molybdopterin-binding protein [Thaumarchaeota archaeon]|nr:molybdopterin-binding protein [Nitrososphaerota archaeon]
MLKVLSVPKQVTVEIAAVGNELLNGTTLDTNSHWLCEHLDHLGMKVQRKTTIRDELGAIANCFRECITRKPDWIISVGGLGPTFDDMTIEGLAKALRRSLVLDDRALAMLKASYSRRAKKLGAKKNRLSISAMKMAKIPLNSKPLSNPVGSAPGVLAKAGKTRIVALPGVPKEMMGIFQLEVAPLLELNATVRVREAWLKISGISESALAPRINKIAGRYAPSIYIKSHPKGFQRGKSILNIQLRSTSLKDDKVATSDLENAALEVLQAAEILGADARRIRSI